MEKILAEIIRKTDYIYCRRYGDPNPVNLSKLTDSTESAAMEITGSKILARPVYLMMREWWNDSLDWSYMVLKDD